MKKIFIAAGLLMIGVLNGQSVLYEKGPGFSPYGFEYSRVEASMVSLAPHRLLTQFSYMDINMVSHKLNQYLDKGIWYGIIDEGVRWEKSGHDSFIIEPYKRKVGGDSKRVLTVKYLTFGTPEGYTLIKSVDITGYFDDVADLFINYWRTSLQRDAVRGGELAVCYTLQDRVSISADRNARQATIRITSTTYKNEDEFYRAVRENAAKNR